MSLNPQEGGVMTFKKDVPIGEIQDGLEVNGMAWSQDRELGATPDVKTSRHVVCGSKPAGDPFSRW